MANSAYLYTSERSNEWKRPHVDEEYCDSRWNIPMAWFFFFRLEDVRLVRVHHAGSSWWEVRFSAEKKAAVKLFLARVPLLLAVVEGRIRRERLDEFAATISERPGRFLLMDPSEIIDGDDLGYARRFARMLQVLGTGDGSPEAAREALEGYAECPNSLADRHEGWVLGFGA